MRKKKSLITKCSAAVMSLLMVAGSVGNYSIVYAANAFKAGDSFKIKYTHNNKISTKKTVDARWNGKKITMATPARKVYNYKNDTNYIMVPGAWTAKQLGIHYKWDGTKRAGCMSAATQSGNSGSTTTTASKPAPMR